MVTPFRIVKMNYSQIKIFFFYKNVYLILGTMLPIINKEIKKYINAYKKGLI